VLRPDDEALLERLEDEELMELLWRSQAPRGAALPPARTAGLVAIVGRTEAGKQARAKAIAERSPKPLHALLLPASTRGLPPELNHHLALWFARLAREYRATDDATFATAFERSTASWLALADEGTYLRDVVQAVAGGAGAGLADDVPFAGIREVGRIAREGARLRTAEGRRALAALELVERAASLAQASEKTAKRAVGLARELTAAAAEEAVAPLGERIAELLARGTVVRDVPAVMEDVAAAWEWARRSRLVEHFAVDQVTPIAWMAYKQPGWEPLQRVVRPLDRLVDSLAERLERAGDERTTTDLAYAGPVAQMYVFRSELSRGQERFTHVERALRLCPTHRNARVTLSGLLCEEALRLLQGGVFVGAAAKTEAKRHYERAKEMFPQQRKLEEVARALG